jgi:hypothetical protein
MQFADLPLVQCGDCGASERAHQIRSKLVELPGKAAGQGCRVRLPGKAAECMVKLDNNAIF